MVSRTELSIWSRLILNLLLFGMLGASGEAKTIQAIPNVPVIAETTWYFVNCETSAGLGSYSLNIAPAYGTVTYADVSGPLPGCPAGSPSLPAVQAYYTWTDTTTTATADSFELYYNLNGQVAAVLDVTVILSESGGGCPSASIAVRQKLPNLKPIPSGSFVTTATADPSSTAPDASPADSTCTPPPTPTASITANGTDITGTTSDDPMIVVIGEQIVLAASISDANGASVQSQSWSIPGMLVKSYGEVGAVSPYNWTISPTCANADCQAVLVQPAELASDTVTYHWIDAVNPCSMQTVNEQQICFRTVTYTASLSNGQSVSAQATLEILQPTLTDPSEALLNGDIGSATIVGYKRGAWSLQLRRILDAPFSGNTSGMTISPNLTAPPDFPGNIYLLQMGSSVQVSKQISGESRQCTLPYAFDHVYLQSEIPENDSPGISLPDSVTRVSLSDSFQTYLLWQPDLPNSIPAPLGVLQWGFAGTAVSHRIFGFEFWTTEADGRSEYVDPFVSSTSYPDPWSNYLKSTTEPRCTRLP